MQNQSRNWENTIQYLAFLAPVQAQEHQELVTSGWNGVLTGSITG